MILCVLVCNDNIPFSSFQEPPSDILIAYQLPISHPVPVYPSRHRHSFGCMQYPPIVAACDHKNCHMSIETLPNMVIGIYSG